MPTTTWWVPREFIFQDAPSAFIAVQTCPPGSDWLKVLRSAGYNLITSCGAEIFPAELEVRVYSHNTEAHLYVEVCDWNDVLSQFFVAEQFENVFFATWYVEFACSAAQIERTKELRTIATSLVAFIRHGHGTGTIDKNGSISCDDVAEWRREEQEALLKQQEKNKKPEETN